MKLKQQIETKLRNALEPVYMEVINESYKHNVSEGAESHFRVRVAASSLEKLSRIERHRKVYELLREELEQGVHALAIEALTPEQWDASPSLRTSPPCAHKER